MAKIYIVSSGSYSDYYIEAVFSTREKAKEYIDHKGLGFEIEEHEMDEPFDKGVKLWEVVLDWNKFDVIRCTTHEQAPPYVGYVLYHRNCINRESLEILVRADTVQRAIKAASEKLRQVKALEDVKYPFLKKRIVSHSPMDIMCDFPIYNYQTGTIILSPLWTLVPGIETPTEVREVAL